MTNMAKIKNKSVIFAYDKVVSDYYYNYVGSRNSFGHPITPSSEEHTSWDISHHLRGNLPYWFSLNNIETNIISVTEAIKSKDKFVYAINQSCLSVDYKDSNLSKLNSKLINAINNDQCIFVINDATEGSIWTKWEIRKFQGWLKEANIQSEKVIVITQNYNYAYNTFPFKMVVWNFYESFCRDTLEDWIETDIDAKKFLCLNRLPHHQKFYFMYQMYKHGILDQFNYSIGKKIENQKTIEEYDQWGLWEWNDDMSKFAKTTPHKYDLNLWEHISSPTWLYPHHKKNNLLYIVTETFYNNYMLEGRYRDVSEKTWKPIALQMPFIMIHTPFALKRLRDLGYKTFHNIWDESYDDIKDDRDRMKAIVDLVVYLNNRTDFRAMIDSCREIVEHNFSILKRRRPESEMIRTISYG